MMLLLSRRQLLAACLATALLSSPARAGLFEREVAFSQADVQAAVDKKGGMQKRYGGLLTATLPQAPKVTLGEPEGRVGVAGRVEVASIFTPQPIPVDVVANAGIRYDDARKAFFLENPVVQSLAAPGLGKDKEPLAREAVTALVVQYLRGQPVYVLREDGSAEEKAARWLLKAVRIEAGRVVATLSPF